MQLRSGTLADRIKLETKEYEKKIAFQTSSQEKIDFINNLNWFKNLPDKYANCEIQTFIYNRIMIQLDEVILEDAIDGLLGPLHRQFDIWWELEINGDVEEPVFEFSIVDNWISQLTIRIKEGAFKQCKIVNILAYTEEAKEARNIFKLKMVCE